MRGFPPLHLILAILAFAAFAVPLARLTFARPAAPAAEAQETTVQDDTAAYLRLSLAHAPSKLQVKLDGKDLLPEKLPEWTGGTMEFPISLVVPKDGLELSLTVAWPEGTPYTAVTVELEPFEKDTQSQTRWTDAALNDEILTFHWKS